MTESSGITDAQLRAYVLRELSEDHERAIELAMLEDDELADRTDAVEHGLIDAYVAGALTDAERKQLGSGLLASSLGKERLAAARDLVALANEAPVDGAAVQGAPPLPAPVDELARRRRRQRSLRAASALGAVAVAAVALLWLRLGAGPSLPTAQSSLVAEVTALSSRGGSALAEFEVATDVAVVELAMPFASMSGSSSPAELTVLLIHEDGEVAHTGTARPGGDSKLRVTVAATALRAGEYRLFVSDGPNAPPRATYGFRVTMQTD